MKAIGMPLSHRIACALFAIVALVVLYHRAHAADLPQETNTALALQAMETAIQQAGVAKQQFDVAFPEFAKAIAWLKIEAATAAYWRDACQSTPGCGGEAAK